MKKRILILIFAIGTLPALRAQHCPFDGGTAEINQLSDTLEVNDTSLRILLVETDNLQADSCTYAEGPLNIPFASIEKALVTKFQGSWEYRARNYVKEKPFTQPGLRAVVLTQAETYCMLKRGNDFLYKKRKFELQVFKNNRLLRIIPVPEEKRYALCTGAGAWTRIEPIKISTKDHN